MNTKHLIVYSIIAILLFSCGPSRQEQLRQEKWEMERRVKEAEERERQRELREQAMNNDCWTTWNDMNKSEKMECINWLLTNVYKIKAQKQRNEEIRELIKADSSTVVRVLMYPMMKCGYMRDLDFYVNYNTY